MRHAFCLLLRKIVQTNLTESLKYAMICGARPMNKPVFSISHTSVAPIHRRRMDGRLGWAGRCMNPNQDPGNRCTRKSAAPPTALPHTQVTMGYTHSFPLHNMTKSCTACWGSSIRPPYKLGLGSQSDIRSLGCQTFGFHRFFVVPAKYLLVTASN